MLKFGDRTQIGAMHLATSLVADCNCSRRRGARRGNVVTRGGLTGELTGSVVSLSGGALLANLVSVILLVVVTVSFHRG